MNEGRARTSLTLEPVEEAVVLIRRAWTLGAVVRLEAAEPLVHTPVLDDVVGDSDAADGDIGLDRAL